MKMFRWQLSILLVISFVISACAKAETEFTLPNGIKVSILEENFDKSDFKVTGCAGSGAVCIINGSSPFGSDLGLPKTYVKSIKIFFQEHSYTLDSSNMYNAWGNRHLIQTDKIRYFGGNCYDSKNCQFRGLFSDAAGAFVAEWQIVNGLQYRTVISNSSDIIGLFSKNIDPPVWE